MYSLRFDMRGPGATGEARAALYQAAIEMSAWAETRGCAAVTISEHHVADDGYLPSPLTLAAAVAAVTKQVPIAIAAVLLPLYDPIKLAEDMIVLDHISRGRVMYTLAIGYRPAEYEFFGLDYARRGAIADEKLAQLLTHVRGGSGITPTAFTPGGPMLSWGGGSIPAARRAGRNGLNFFAQGNAPGLQEAYDASARAAGHEPGMCMLPDPSTPMSVFVNDDLDQGWADVGTALLADARSYGEWNETNPNRETTASLSRGRTVDELRAEGGSHRVVTVDEAAALIRKSGVLGLQPLCGGLHPDVAWTYLRRVVDEVLPRVKG